MDNVFEIQNPDQCSCQIWYYQAGMSHLILAVRNLLTQECQYIIFSDVLYVSAPTLWAGTNFVTKQGKDHDQILCHLGFEKYEGNARTIYEVLINDRSLSYPNKIRILIYKIYKHLFVRKQRALIIARSGQLISERQYRQRMAQRAGE